jgi:hypothetical protein
MVTPLDLLGIFRFANYTKQEEVFVKRTWSAAVLPARWPVVRPEIH